MSSQSFILLKTSMLAKAKVVVVDGEEAMVTDGLRELEHNDTSAPKSNIKMKFEDQGEKDDVNMEHET